MQRSDAEEAEEYACLVCGGLALEEEGPQVMLECDRCLAGCHMGCCSPALEEVPEVRRYRWQCGWWAAGNVDGQSSGPVPRAGGGA